MNPQYTQIILSFAYMVFLFLVFIMIMNWSAIRRFLIHLTDIILAIVEAFCKYEESSQKLTPEERTYLQNDINLFI